MRITIAALTAGAVGFTALAASTLVTPTSSQATGSAEPQAVVTAAQEPRTGTFHVANAEPEERAGSEAVVATSSGEYPMPGGPVGKCEEWFELRANTLYPTALVDVSEGGNLQVDLREAKRASEGSYVLYGRGCEGESDVIEKTVTLNVPIVINGPSVVTPWSSEAPKRYAWEASANGTDPVRITVVRKNKPVKSKTSDTNTAKVSVKIGKTTPRAGWEVRAVSGEYSTVLPVYVAGKWAALHDELTTFEKCSTVTYHIDDTKRPKKVEAIDADVSEAFRRLSNVTGLTFTEINDAQEADITFSWAKIKGPAAGIGGQEVTTSSDGVSVKGSVVLDTNDKWLRKSGYGSQAGQLPGRGALLLHEISHVLGLGHVDHGPSLMNPVTLLGSSAKLTKGEKEGLRYLYEPQSC